MDEPALRKRPERAAVYWRRRVAVLVISMSVLGGITWSAAAVLSSAANAGKAAAGRAGLAAGSSQHGSSAGARSSAGQNGVSADSGVAVPVRPTGPPCPASDVAVTLSATRPSYPAWQQPAFAVDVKSSAGFACSFDIGSGHVLLQISAGAAQVWTSADCAEGLASEPVTLNRSVPAVLTMTWDAQYSSVGCPVPGRAAPAGTYTAKATDGSVVSNDVTFTIS
jgi:hypothetical protein